MTAATITAIGGILTAVITGALALIGVLRSVRAQRETTEADREVGILAEYRGWARQIREDAAQDRRELEERLDQQEHAITDLRRRLNLVEARERVLLDYAHRLRAHIDRELGPPAPPWPDILIT